MSLEAVPQSENADEIFPCDRQHDRVQPALQRGIVDPSLARRSDGHVVAAGRHSLCLVENPDLLPAPATRGLRMKNSHAAFPQQISRRQIPPLLIYSSDAREYCRRWSLA